MRFSVHPQGIPLESLDDRETEVAAEFNWRSLLARLTRIDLGPSKEQAYERGAAAQLTVRRRFGAPD